ncbi:hypothetical protein HK096_010613, partial [Nowakowskiella sp. JEL0078]
MQTSDSSIFSLEGKGLKLNSASDVNAFVDEISKRTNLTEIKLNGNTLGVEASQALAKALSLQKNLKVVDLSDSFTGRLREEIPLALDAFVDALIDKEYLTELNLSDNAFGPAGATPLLRLLTTNRNLQVLRLNNNGLGPEGGCDIANALAGISKLSSTPSPTVSKLHTLIMGRNRLENKAAQILSQSLSHLPSLQHLALPQNGIRPEGIQAIVKALPACQLLETLDLQDNTFTDKGAKALAAGLARSAWKNIKVLNIGDCLLGAAGSADILRAIVDSKLGTIKTLILTFDELDENAAGIIPSIIRANSNLERIELNGNAFNPEGSSVKKIKDALREIGQTNALDVLDEMEFDEEEDEEEEDNEEVERGGSEVPSELKDDSDLDDL